MSNLNPDVLILDKGLNLQSAKITAPTGSVLDCINYEQVDFQGQKRIDGFTRYDGDMLSAQDDYYIITTTTATVPAPADEQGVLSDADGNFLGHYMRYPGDATDTKFLVALYDLNRVPVATDVLSFRNRTTYVVLGTGTVSTIVTSSSEPSTTVQYDNLLALNSYLRGFVESLPGAIIGLHWFRDRLYAVADVLTASIDGTTPEIFPNDVLVSGGDTAKVLGAITLANTRVLFLSSLNTAVWATVGADVTRNAISVGSISDGFQSFTAAQELASFYESRTEAQVLEEDSPGPYDFGWRFVDQGWSVLFEKGISLFGSLPSLNQNITGLGTQGPTSTSGNNGRPLILLQRVNITNDQSQVNGWKSSQTASSYFLDPDNLTSVDTDYIYADAYLSWDGASGIVTAPGITTGTLIEYPATNTVEVDV